MLKRLHLKEFQCHEDLILDLDMVSVIVGDNDCGKSSVIRALKWAALNEWDGKADAMIRWGQDSCEVILHYDEHVVHRIKGKGVNSYILNGQEFKAFGQKVPDPVLKSLSLTPDNFSNQNDPTFWLTLNSSQAAAALNEIFNLSDIDVISSNAAGAVRQTRMQVSMLEASVQRSKETASKLAWVEEADKELQELEALATNLEACENDSYNIGHTLAKLKECEEAIETEQELLALGEEAVQAAKALEDVHCKTSLIKVAIDLEDRICDLQKKLQAKERQLKKELAGKCPLCQRG